MPDSETPGSPLKLTELKAALQARQESMIETARSVADGIARSPLYADFAHISQVPPIRQREETPRPTAHLERPKVVRFTRLGGDADETVDLDQCLLLMSGPCDAQNPRTFDLQRMIYYYLTPEGRGIMGLGGSGQARFGGGGYREVHPMLIVHDRLLNGLKIPPELAKYLPYLTPERSLPEAITAWEKSQSGRNVHDLENETGSGGSEQNAIGIVPSDREAQEAKSLDDLTPTAWKLLKAIRLLHATNSESAKSRPDIAAKAKTGNHDSDHNKDAFRRLSDLGLITAKKRIGTWLTDAGMSALDKRS